MPSSNRDCYIRKTVANKTTRNDCGGSANGVPAVVNQKMQSAISMNANSDQKMPKQKQTNEAPPPRMKKVIKVQPPAGVGSDPKLLNPQQDKVFKQPTNPIVEFGKIVTPDFLRQYKKSMMEEVLEQCCNAKTFGRMLDLTSQKSFYDCVEQNDLNTTTIIHVYDCNIATCVALNKCLEKLAADYPFAKFAKFEFSVMGLGQELRKKGPALIAYKGRTIVGNFARLTENYINENFNDVVVESFLIENDLVIDKRLYNCII